MPVLRVYSRQGCHLCEDMVEELVPLLRGRLAIEVCDIDTRTDWREKYNIRIPVAEYDGRLVSEYPLNRKAVSALLDSLPPPPANDQ